MLKFRLLLYTLANHQLKKGYPLSVFGINKYTELFSFDYNLINALVCGCVSAGTSYFLSMVLNDFGIKIYKRGGDEK